MYGKPLAHVEKIKSLVPIEGADKIVLATVLDWNVIVKKDEFNVGDKCVYIEIDSKVPSPEPVYNENGELVKYEKPEYEMFAFLEKKKYKVKSIKMRGVFSQGVVFKLEDLKLDPKLKVGTDVTKELGITEIVMDKEEAGIAKPSSVKHCWLYKKMMRFAWFRKFDKKLYGSTSLEWQESWPAKSDEENVQRVWSKMNELYPNERWYKTEKLEGQNMSIVVSEPTLMDRLKGRKKHFQVNSRTRGKSEGSNDAFWQTFKRERFADRLNDLDTKGGKTWFIRGEHVGPGIQKNIYKLPKTDLIIFDVYAICDSVKIKLDWEEMIDFCITHNLELVPFLGFHNGPLPDVQEMLKESDEEKSCFRGGKDHKREGIVWRLMDDTNVSFKVKNPNYEI